MVIEPVLANLQEILQSFEYGIYPQPIRNIVTKKILNNGEKNVLKASINSPRVRGNFSGTRVRQPGTVNRSTACFIS